MSIRGSIYGRVAATLGMKLSAMLFMLSVALAISTAPALAVQRYGPISGRIGEVGAGGSGNGEFSSPNGVAVDQATGDVYVVDTGNNRVEKFDASGTYLAQFDGATTPAGSFSGPTAVAIDQTTDDVYVVDTGNNVVDKFTSTGEYICQLSGWERSCQALPAGSPTFSTPIGVAVDPTTGGATSEDVYVSDKETKTVDVFGSTGDDVAQFASEHRPWGLAVDANHNVYVAETGAEEVREYTALGAEPINDYSLTIGNVGPGVRTVGVEPISGDVFIGADPGGYELLEFNAAGQPIPAAGVNGFGGNLMPAFGEASSPGIAVNSVNQTVYVVDPGDNVVNLFDLVTVPEARSGPPTNVTATSATLTGEVNPLGTSEASGYFEYGETTAYGATVPAPPGDSVGAGSVFTAVTPEKVEGLVPGTTYHYRLDATNSAGLVETGGDESFTTPAEIPKVEEPPPFVSNVTPESAVFHGTVQPGNGAVTYHFVYGLTGAYGNSLPDIGIGGGLSPVEVEQTSGVSLRPGTTYHFALVAKNTSGTAMGLDQIFTTPSTSPPPTAPPTIGLGPISAVSQTEATLSAKIGPEGHATTYAFELGYAAGSYETRIFGNLAGEPEPTTVTATFANLQPGTVYHFRVIATNAAGTTATPDETFATAQFPQTIAIPPALALVPTPVFPVVHYPPLPVKCKKGFVRHGRKCVRKKKPPKHKKRHR